jgi:hypothetical protein
MKLIECVCPVHHIANIEPVPDEIAREVAKRSLPGKPYLLLVECDKCLKLRAAPRLFRQFQSWKKAWVAKLTPPQT